MVSHRFSVLCFSAVSTIFRITNIPFRTLTRSMYPFAIFSRSAFDPSDSSSLSVQGTQNGSSSSITYLPHHQSRFLSVNYTRKLTR